MSRHYEEIATFEREGFEVIVDKTYEDIDPWSQLSECFDSKKQLYADIDSGKWDWFMLRVRVMFRGLELGSHYLGRCLYENAADVLTDGTAEDCIGEALREARREALALKMELVELDLERYAEAE
jgi:hypothetical protein